MSNKNYGAMAFLATLFSVVAHYLLFSGIQMHSTLHALIGILFFFLSCGVLSMLFERKKKKKSK